MQWHSRTGRAGWDASSSGAACSSLLVDPAPAGLPPTLSQALFPTRLFLLLQVMTLENWPSIMFKVQAVAGERARVLLKLNAGPAALPVAL